MSVSPFALTQQPPLLRTKITIPPLPLKHVQRQRLTERIERGVTGPLTLLAAPAGFGKTNLLIEWTCAMHLQVAWLNIDSDDNDIARFFRYLIGSIQVLEPQLGEEALDIILSTRRSGLEVGLTLLINEIAALPRETALVLDDFQDLEDEVILGGLNFLLKHLPNNLHLVISSRSQPSLELAYLRAKGKLVELGADDLRFTGEEVALFIQQTMGLHLPIETIQILQKRTDGWVTALQLAAVSLRNQTNPDALLANLEGNAHVLVDFLAEEVLDRQPEEIRQFLLRSSVLEKMNSALCEAVVKPGAQPGYGTVMLNRLEQNNLFITALDEKHEWFKYHPLFADFLRHIQTEINPEEIPVLQKRAALWFEANGELDNALQYALASGDLALAADLIARNAESVIKTGEFHTLIRWISKLPEELIHQRPQVGLAYAWGLIAAYQLDLAQYWIDDVQRYLNQHEVQHPPFPVDGNMQTDQNRINAGFWNIRGGLAVCQSTLALLSGDLELAAEYSQQATNYLREENPFVYSLFALEDSLYFILSGDTQKAIDSLRNTIRIARQANNLLVLIVATCELAEIQVFQGQLSRAWATLQKAQYLTLGPGEKPLPLAGLVDIGLGEILLERNLLEEARVYLERGCRSFPTIWPSRLDGLISLARLLQAQGDISESNEILTEATHVALSTESSRWDDIIISAVGVRLALLRNDISAAAHWWIKGRFPDIDKTIELEKYPYHIFEYLMLIQARFLLMKGEENNDAVDLKRALEYLETLQFEAERFRRVTSQIEIAILKARAQFALGNEQAVKSLLHALALGEPEGYRRIFLDEGWHLADLLRRCISAQQESDIYLPSVGFIESLLESISSSSYEKSVLQQGIKPQSISPKILIEEPSMILSAREMEVLALIAEGKSNQEISTQLYLALNTVKRHAYNIYSKLEVKNRTQAVSKARQLGLIP